MRDEDDVERKVGKILRRAIADRTRYLSERVEASEEVLRDFIALTWWAEDVGGAYIVVPDDRRSETEVREIINLRRNARAALGHGRDPK